MHKLNKKVLMSLNIDIKNVSLNGTNGPLVLGDALNAAGVIDQIIDHVNNSGLTSDKKIETFMDCLSQTLSEQGRLQGECESRLNATIYNWAKDYPVNCQSVMKSNRFRYNPKLKETITKANYLSSSHFNKFIHHLTNVYGNNRYYGVNYFTTGIGLLLSEGLLNLFSPDTKEDSNRFKLTLSIISTGSVMMAIPLVNSFYLSFGDEP